MYYVLIAYKIYNQKLKCQSTKINPLESAVGMYIYNLRTPVVNAGELRV